MGHGPEHQRGGSPGPVPQLQPAAVQDPGRTGEVAFVEQCPRLDSICLRHEVRVQHLCRHGPAAPVTEMGQGCSGGFQQLGIGCLQPAFECPFHGPHPALGPGRGPGQLVPNFYQQLQAPGHRDAGAEGITEHGVPHPKVRGSAGALNHHLLVQQGPHHFGAADVLDDLAAHRPGKGDKLQGFLLFRRAAEHVLDDNGRDFGSVGLQWSNQHPDPVPLGQLATLRGVVEQRVKDPGISARGTPDGVDGSGRDRPVKGVGEDFLDLLPVHGSEIHAVGEAVVPELCQRLGQPRPWPASSNHAGPAGGDHVGHDAGGRLVQVVGVVHHQQQWCVLARLQLLKVAPHGPEHSHRGYRVFRGQLCRVGRQDTKRNAGQRRASVDLDDDHLRGKPLRDGIGQGRLADARPGHHKDCLAGAAADDIADPVQRFTPSREQAICGPRFRWVAVRRVQSDHPWRLRPVW